MSAHCSSQSHGHDHGADPTPLSPQAQRRYRRVLWAALAVNAAMCGIEIAGGLKAGSLALLADSADFAGDAFNYGISVAVLSSALVWRAKAALLKAASMAAFGLWVFGAALWRVWHGLEPEAAPMGAVALLALAANLGVGWLLYAFRNGDANMRSVWLCTRNDALGNLAVLGAALAVGLTQTRWPDLAVAAFMAALALFSAWAVGKLAWAELRHGAGEAHE